MDVKFRRAIIAFAFALVGVLTFLPRPQVRAQAPGTVDLRMYAAEMRWRSIGPFRGGRTKAISGVPGQPNVFYMAPVNGGVWKTSDFGRTWTPIFDDQPTGSIGAIAPAPSDANIIYARRGGGVARPGLSPGGGILKCIDARKRWSPLGPPAGRP